MARRQAHRLRNRTSSPASPIDHVVERDGRETGAAGHDQPARDQLALLVLVVLLPAPPGSTPSARRGRRAPRPRRRRLRASAMSSPACCERTGGARAPRGRPRPRRASPELGWDRGDAGSNTSESQRCTATVSGTGRPPRRSSPRVAGEVVEESARWFAGLQPRQRVQAPPIVARLDDVGAQRRR